MDNQPGQIQPLQVYAQAPQNVQGVPNTQCAPPLQYVKKQKPQETPDTNEDGPIEKGEKPEEPDMEKLAVAPQAVQANYTVLQSYQPQFQMSYQPVVYVPTNYDQYYMTQFQVQAQPVMLPPQDPNSPYYYNPGAPQMQYTAMQIEPGHYEGGIQDDMRHGLGTCTWSDGSYYQGDWVQNVRHGNGLYKAVDGTVYEGQWVNDKKHGHGRLTHPDGEEINCTWENDRLNGLAQIKKPGSQEKTVIYKNDMLIMTNESGVSCCDVFYVIVSIILMLAFYAAIPLGLLLDKALFAIMFVYIVYLIYSCCTAATKYINNLTPLDKTFDNIDRAINAAPQIHFHIQNYHYETRVTHDSEGRTHHRRVRVNTHYASRSYKFHQWEDHSPPSSTVHFLSVLLLARLHTEKKFKYSPRAKSSRKQQKRSFMWDHRRDTHYEYWKTEEIPFQAEHCLVYNKKRGREPWFTKCWVLVLLDIILFGWIQRLWLSAKTKIVEYQLKKYIVY